MLEAASLVRYKFVHLIIYSKEYDLTWYGCLGIHKRALLAFINSMTGSFDSRQVIMFRFFSDPHQLWLFLALTSACTSSWLLSSVLFLFCTHIYLGLHGSHYWRHHLEMTALLVQLHSG